MAPSPKRVQKSQKVAPLAALPNFKRPRERMWRLGPANVTTTELLAIILGHGVAGCNVLQLAAKAETWLAQTKLQLQPAQPQTAPGFGRAQSLKLIAIQELCRRATQSNPATALLSPQAIIDQVGNLSKAKQEKVLAFFVDARYFLLEKRIIAIGKHNTVSVEPRDVFAPALQLPAHGVILVHNHPSGNPEPSTDDFDFTHRMLQASELLGVALIDHIIVGINGWYSFGQHGLHDAFMD
ncbi:DNA repair protein RadC [Candidatus Woesebacteria bacterium]|nr:DNA repair protein RadC [Candidatus Woesebacteria bacterium]